MTALYVIIVVLLVLATYCATMAALHGKAANAWLFAVAVLRLYGEGEENDQARERAERLSARAARYNILMWWRRRTAS